MVSEIIVNIFKWVILLCLLISCDQQKSVKECANPIGNLLFDKINLNFGDVTLGEKRIQMLKVYNPTADNIVLKVYDKESELSVLSSLRDSISLYENNLLIHSHIVDTFFVVFSPRDTSLIGSYLKGIHMELNGRIYVTPIKINARVHENFDMLSYEKKIPILNIKTNEINLDTIFTDNFKFPIYNIGSSDLIIRKIESTCGCTSLILETNIIPPKDSTNLSIKYNVMGRKGFQRNTIKIYCNDPKRSELEIFIKGYIK